ncbi:MAG: NTP transferase domain-containing protein [Cyanobacteria bacterium J06626_6]
MILAGGHSTRMGQDKALLRLPSGQTLLSQTVEVVRSLTPDIKIVTPWPEKYQSSAFQSSASQSSASQSSVSAGVPPADVEWVKEPLPKHPLPTRERQKSSAGPLSGFGFGWAQVSSDWCLLLACDLPYLEAAALQDWWDWIIANQQNGWPGLEHPMASLSPMEGPYDGQRWEPLCGYYHRSCIQSLQCHIGLGQCSFQDWLSAVTVVSYEAAPKRLFFNCNWPSEWPFGQ